MHFCYFRIVHIAQHSLPEPGQVVQADVDVRPAAHGGREVAYVPCIVRTTHGDLVTPSSKFIAMLQ
jgi:hypothetical protein